MKQHIFSGNKYVNPELETHRFCIRTGTGSNDIVKYGLTTQSSASQYCGFKFNVSGKEAYIGRYQGGTHSNSEFYEGNFGLFSKSYSRNSRTVGYTSTASTESIAATINSSKVNNYSMSTSSSNSYSSENYYISKTENIHTLYNTTSGRTARTTYRSQYFEYITATYTKLRKSIYYMSEEQGGIKTNFDL